MSFDAVGWGLLLENLSICVLMLREIDVCIIFFFIVDVEIILSANGDTIGSDIRYFVLVAIGR